MLSTAKSDNVGFWR